MHHMGCQPDDHINCGDHPQGCVTLGSTSAMYPEVRASRTLHVLARSDSEAPITSRFETSQQSIYDAPEPRLALKPMPHKFCLVEWVETLRPLWSLWSLGALRPLWSLSALRPLWSLSALWPLWSLGALRPLWSLGALRPLWPLGALRPLRGDAPL